VRGLLLQRKRKTVAVCVPAPIEFPGGARSGPDGGQAVGNDNGGAADHYTVQRLLRVELGLFKCMY
jgi:hypothetical protein